MRRRFAILLWALGAITGCRDETAPAPSARPTTAATAPPHQIPHLSPEQVQGTFPPAWRLGDEWMVATHTKGYPSGAQIDVYGLRVVGVPDAEHPEYRIRIGTARNGKPVESSPLGILHFRATDGTLAVYQGVEQDTQARTRDSLPCWKEWSSEFPLLAYPGMPPAREAMFTLPPLHPGEDSRWQTIIPTPDGLRFTIWVEAMTNLEWVEMEWRRGEPWWSTLRAWVISSMEEELTGGGPLAPVLTASADLLREEDMHETTSSRGGLKIRVPKQWPPRPRVDEWPTRNEPGPTSH